MPPFTWDDSFSVGVAKLDMQHEALIDLMNRAYTRVEEGVTDADLEQLAMEMLNYAFMHFATEEELMAAYAYPDREIHQGMHEIFKQKATEYQQEAKEGKADFLVMIQFLAEWLNGHIAGSDKKLGLFLNRHGIY